MILPVWCGKMWRMGVVVVVFSDLVASTVLLTRLGDDLMDRLMNDDASARVFAYIASGLGVAFGDPPGGGR